MPYLSSIERLALEEGHHKGREEGLQEGREEGRQEGMLELIELDLVEKFGKSARKILKPVRELGDLAKLRQFARHLKKAKTLEEVRNYLNDQ